MQERFPSHGCHSKLWNLQQLPRRIETMRLETDASSVRTHYATSNQTVKIYKWRCSYFLEFV